MMITENYMSGRDIYTIRIGQNKTENWHLLDKSDEKNIWFHVSDTPSAYVILDTMCDIKQLPKMVIYRCAVLCKMHSKSIKNKHATINYTYVKHVTKGDYEGEAIISKAKNIRV